MKLIFVVLVLLTLAGCCTKPALQRIEIPIPVPCVKIIPAKPMLPTVPETGIFDQAKTMVARDRMYEDYTGELEAVVVGCAKL